VRSFVRHPPTRRYTFVIHAGLGAVCGCAGVAATPPGDLPAEGRVEPPVGELRGPPDESLRKKLRKNEMPRTLTTDDLIAILEEIARNSSNQSARIQAIRLLSEMEREDGSPGAFDDLDCLPTRGERSPAQRFLTRTPPDLAPLG
jgi:hypothetical protein